MVSPAMSCCLALKHGRLCPQVVVKGPAPTTVTPGATREGLHTFTYCARSTGADCFLLKATPMNAACHLCKDVDAKSHSKPCAGRVMTV